MFVRYSILCVSCIKVSLTVSGALDVCCMYAVCSCTNVPLAVSGVRILGMYCVSLHQSAFSAVGCRDIMFGIMFFCSLNQGALSGVGCVERISCHACCVFVHQRSLSGVGWKKHGRCGVL